VWLAMAGECAASFYKTGGRATSEGRYVIDSPRPVRIPRPTTPPPSADRATGRSSPRGAPPPNYHPNRAGTQRTVRLTLTYLAMLVAIYAAFVLYARTGPSAADPGITLVLLELTGFAAVLAIVGAVLTLTPAPRGVIAEPDAYVVVGRWGGRVSWGPLTEVTVRQVRRYPAGLFSSAAVDSVEVSQQGRRRRSYLVEEGLLPDSRDTLAPR
jgi:hypothetical protein